MFVFNFLSVCGWDLACDLLITGRTPALSSTPPSYQALENTLLYISDIIAIFPAIMLTASLLRILLTLIARLNVLSRAMDCSAGMRLKNAVRCCVINVDVLMVFSRWSRDAACVWHRRADAITASTLLTQSAFCSRVASSNASGKPLAYNTAISTFNFVELWRIGVISW